MARSPDANRVLQAVRAVVGVRADRDSGRGSGNWRSGSESGKWWVAFSGGVDSSVLLDAAARVLGGQAATGLAAVHVNHGLHPDAGDWEDHCRTVADGLGIRLEVRRVAVSGERGQGGLEAAARLARHAALRDVVPPGEAVLLAHHLDDQAETVLHRILRGAGPAGIAAMRPEATVGGLRLVRPLLAVPRSEILDYAATRSLSWVEDPGNLAAAHDRNHLRHRVMPVLAERWPDAGATLARLGERAHETASMLDGLAAVDLEAARGRAPEILCAAAIAALPPVRAENALRVWLVSRHGIAPPPRHWLRVLVKEAASARSDRLPDAARGGIWIRRYRGELHTGSAHAGPQLPERAPWRLGDGQLDLPHGRLSVARAEGEGLAIARLPPAVDVRFRRGGERCRPAGRGVTKPLKDLFRELGIPPWERGRRPLVFAGDCLAAAPGLFVCDPFAAHEGEPAWRIEWLPHQRG